MRKRPANDVEAKDRDALHLLRRCSAGLSDREIAELEGATPNAISMRRERAYRWVAYRSGLSREIVIHLFWPRRGRRISGPNQDDWPGRYSGPAVTLERVVSLLEFGRVAEMVALAQSQFNEFGVQDVEVHLRRLGAKRPSTVHFVRCTRETD